MRKEYDFDKMKGRRNPYAKHLKKQVTIRIGVDIIDYFKGQVQKAGGGNYQTMINNALRDYLNKQQVPLNEEILRRVIREELHSTQ